MLDTSLLVPTASLPCSLPEGLVRTILATDAPWRSSGIFTLSYLDLSEPPRDSNGFDLRVDPLPVLADMMGRALGMGPGARWSRFKGQGGKKLPTGAALWQLERDGLGVIFGPPTLLAQRHGATTYNALKEIDLQSDKADRHAFAVVLGERPWSDVPLGETTQAVEHDRD